MKKLIFLALTSAFSLAGAPPDDDHVAGRLLAHPKQGADPVALKVALTQVGARLEKVLDGINIHVLQLPDAALDQVSAALMKTGQFTFVERDFNARGAAIVPTDPNFSSEWHLQKIQAPDAWGIATGSSASVVAIIDSGVDPTHPDLSSKLVSGWSFLRGDSNTADVLGHGTAVAGVAAAASNNGVGIAGVTWRGMIMPLVVLNSSDYASYSNIASAITYAADRGVRVMNISIGGSSSSSTLQSAVNYAWNKGAVIFASAMNNSNSTPYYPAACANVVAVSATDSTNNLASFSSFGSWVALAAPGANILTTSNGGGYGYWSGTSFSSPIAAGVASLVLSIKPGLSNSALVALLEQNTIDLGTPGFDQYFGYGQVNAYKALLGATASGDATAPSVSIASPATGSTLAGVIQVQGTATDNVAVTSIQLLVDNQLVASSLSSPFSFSLNTANYANGSHTLLINAADAAGNIGSAAISVSVNNPIADTTRPSVSITNPATGSTVADVIQVQGVATDNVAVTSIQLLVDNQLVASSLASPFSFSLNTANYANGSHTLLVKAADAAGNIGSASVSVNISNTCSSGSQRSSRSKSCN